MELVLLLFFVSLVVLFVVAIWSGVAAPNRSRYEEYEELYGNSSRFHGQRPPDHWDRMNHAREVALNNVVPLSSEYLDSEPVPFCCAPDPVILGRNKNLTRTSAVKRTVASSTIKDKTNAPCFAIHSRNGSRGGGQALA